MVGLIGQATVNMDDKGRFPLPAKFRSAVDLSGQLLVSESAVLTKGMDGCLILYPEGEWQELQLRMSSMPFTTKDYRAFSRRFYSLAESVNIDKTGRIMIPPRLVIEAKLRKELLVLGVNRWLEIWDPIRYDYFMEQSAGSYEEAAERLFSPPPVNPV